DAVALKMVLVFPCLPVLAVLHFHTPVHNLCVTCEQHLSGACQGHACLFFQFQDGEEYLQVDEESENPLKRKSPYILKRQLHTNKVRRPYILKRTSFY
uniref:Neurotensin/neuromedin N n=1 Tax=Electrophorus electricus TaxID=8005 RepID=A0A4W4EJ27_ELEEL